MSLKEQNLSAMRAARVNKNARRSSPHNVSEMSLKERNYSVLRAARATRIARSPSPLNVAGRPSKKQKNSSAFRAARAAKIPRSPSPSNVARMSIRERKSRAARLADIEKLPSHLDVRQMSASPSEAGETSSTTTLDNDFVAQLDRLSSEHAAEFDFLPPDLVEALNRLVSHLQHGTNEMNDLRHCVAGHFDRINARFDRIDGQMESIHERADSIIDMLDEMHKENTQWFAANLRNGAPQWMEDNIARGGEQAESSRAQESKPLIRWVGMMSLISTLILGR